MKKNISVYTNFILGGNCLTPDELRSVADQMEESGYLFLEIEEDHDNAKELCVRLETDKEYETRIKQELAIKKKAEKYKTTRTLSLIKEAKSIGLQIKLTSPVQTNYQNVYMVEKGMMEWIDKDGFIWYDEVGEPHERVYKTALAAKKSLDKHCKEVLK